jgi:hypothetical protein
VDAMILDPRLASTSSRILINLSPLGTRATGDNGVSLLARVTRLGEFSPNGGLFALGSCMKITE